MNTDFDYSLVPENYVHCFNADCRHGDNCLHRLAALHAPKEPVVLRCVNPVAYPKPAGMCPHLRSADKVRLAWGISALCNEVPYGIATGLLSKIRQSFSKPTYYRILHQERPLYVEEQKMIADLFACSGTDGKPVYDRYTEEYDWKD